MIPLSQRPLTASQTDSRLFVDREDECRRLHAALDLGLNVLVLGESGTGKTSLIRQVLARMDNVRTTFLSARSTSDPAQLIHEVGVVRRSESDGPGPGDATGDPRDFAGVWARKSGISEPHDPLSERLVRLATAPLGDRTGKELVVVDDAQPELAVGLFGAFRDVLWESPIRWIVVGRAERRHEYLRPPADTFFETVVELQPLSEKDARRLLRARLQAASGGDEEGVDRLKALVPLIVDAVGTQRTPRRLLETAREALLADGPAELLGRLQSAQQKAASLGRTHAMVYNVLESLAPVHAGDEEVLERLGLSRARVVQVLKDLESEGLVTSRREGKRVVYDVSPREAAQSRTGHDEAGGGGSVRIVSPDGGGWKVAKLGARRASSRHSTQKSAVERAREIVRNRGGGTIRVHDADGKVSRETDVT